VGTSCVHMGNGLLGGPVPVELDVSGGDVVDSWSNYRDVSGSGSHREIVCACRGIYPSDRSRNCSHAHVLPHMHHANGLKILGPLLLILCYELFGFHKAYPSV
jgi:hypothetical protein